MRIELRMPSTGVAYFPGLAKPVMIDSKDLSPHEAAELERLVQAAGWFDQPAQVGTRSPDPHQLRDQRQYVCAIEEGGRRRELTLPELVEDPALQSLLNYVKGLANRQRAAERMRVTGQQPQPPE